MGSIPVSHKICFCFSSFVGLLFSLYLRKHRSFFPISSLPRDSSASCAKLMKENYSVLFITNGTRYKFKIVFSANPTKNLEMKSQYRQRQLHFFQSVNQSSNREAKEDLLQSVFLALFYFSMEPVIGYLAFGESDSELLTQLPLDIAESHS